MDEKRMVGDYTVINSMYIGHREIILGENPKAASGERYVCCYAERVMFYEQYLEAQVSDDFAEIVKLYGERVTQAADEIMKETEKVTSEIGMNDEITAKDCKPISHDDATSPSRLMRWMQIPHTISVWLLPRSFGETASRL